MRARQQRRRLPAALHPAMKGTVERLILLAGTPKEPRQFAKQSLSRGRHLVLKSLTLFAQRPIAQGGNDDVGAHT